MPRVSANPFIKLVPNQKRIADVIKLDMFESRIEGHALPKPSVKAFFKLLPIFFSSLKRSNIKMFASTAVPIYRIKPAMPAALKVTEISLKIVSIKTV